MNRSFLDEVKHQWKHGGMHIKLIGVNLAVFVIIKFILVTGALVVPKGSENPAEALIYNIFSLRGDFYGFLTHPWGLFTSIFAHFGFMHILFNMIFLYFIARFFLSYFSNQRMLYTYILGGIAGGLFQIAAYSTFPALQGTPAFVVGASGAVNAIFMAAAFYRPMAEVHLFGRFKVKMIYIALIFFFADLFQMGGADNVAHFAHLGGAIFGFLSIYKIDSKNNIITLSQRFVKNIKSIFKGKSKMKVHHGGRGKSTSNTSTKAQTDAEYNLQKKKKQEEIDIILDKISKSGYDSLTKREKQILFDQSN